MAIAASESKKSKRVWAERFRPGMEALGGYVPSNEVRAIEEYAYILGKKRGRRVSKTAALRELYLTALKVEGIAIEGVAVESEEKAS